VVPDVESMLPEGRGERRARIYKMWQDGAFGPPMSPQALRQLHELSRFPHMSRTAKPGGINWTTAEQENGELLQGGNPPTYDWYDDAVHLMVHEEFMASPQWRRLPDNIKLAFVEHRQRHLMNAARKQAAQLQAQQAALGGLGGGRRGRAPEEPPPNPRGQPPEPPAGVPVYPTAAGIEG
jgi:hypothetical protein